MAASRPEGRWKQPPAARRQVGNALQLVAGATVLAVGAQSLAAPIRFENLLGSDHFDWRPLVSGDRVCLNVLKDATSQHGTETSLIMSACYVQRARDPQDTRVRRLGLPGEGPQCCTNQTGYYNYMLPLDEGTPIPTPEADGCASTGITYWAKSHPDWLFEGQHTLFVPEIETYIGVRFNDTGGGSEFQYGWIGVTPEWITIEIEGTPTDVLVLDAFAWGYETEPAVPIAAGAPEPGTLSSLAFGAAAVMRPLQRHSGIS